MKLADEQVLEIRRFLTRNKPCLSRLEPAESRRIEGEIVEDERDIACYESVVIFIERGLGFQDELIRQVFGLVARVQNDSHFDYPVRLYSFGWDDGLLHGTGRTRSGGPNVRCEGWVRDLYDVSANAGPMPFRIPSLFPPVAQEGAPLKLRSNDLLIFFCKDRNARVTEAARARYAKPLKHAVWIWFEADDVHVKLGPRSDELPMSKPGAYSTGVGKRNTGETAYQRAIIAQGRHRLENLGLVTWLDIELPVIFGKSARRRSLDLLGRDDNKRLVLCELKYDKPEKTRVPCKKPTTDDPAHALQEILDYFSHVLKNARRLQDGNVTHTNRRGDWDWKECESPDNSVLIVAANRAYWKHWQGYNPKSGKGGWQEIKNQIADIICKFPKKPVIKFYATPDSDYNIQASSKTDQGPGYTPTPLVGDWHEVALS